MSKQRKWQKVRREKGLCVQCGKRAEPVGLCHPCREKNRLLNLENQRHKAAAKRGSSDPDT